MDISNKIEEFVASILTFKPSVQLKVVSTLESPEKRRYLAAKGGKSTSVGMQKRGILSDPQERLLIRVFEDERNDCYHLYFVSEKDSFSKKAILTSPDTFKYFIVDREGHVVIPKADNIDPMISNLSLAFSKVQFTLDLAEEAGDNKGQMTEGGIQLQYAVDSEHHKIHFRCIESEKKASPVLTKLMLIAFKKEGLKMITRLVSLRNGWAEVQLPEGIEREIQVCLYA